MTDELRYNILFWFMATMCCAFFAIQGYALGSNYTESVWKKRMLSDKWVDAVRAEHKIKEMLQDDD